MAFDCLELFRYENRIEHKIHSFILIAPRFLNTRDGTYIDPLDEEDKPGQVWETDGDLEYQSGTNEKVKNFTHTKCVLFTEPKCL